MIPGSKCALAAAYSAEFDAKATVQNIPWKFEKDLASIVATVAISANNEKPMKARTQRFLLHTTKIHKSSTTKSIRA